jgi:hypothetical protein
MEQKLTRGPMTTGSQHDKIVVKNAKTGQTMETGRKLFESIYKDKGFEIVTRDNVDADGRRDPAKSSNAKKGEPKSSTGSAADVATRLGLKDDEATPDKASGSGTPDKALTAAAGNEGAINAIEANTDDAVTDERPSIGRDRGRNR